MDVRIARKVAALSGLAGPPDGSDAGFGHAWFARREAGSLLRELWNEGQRQNADQMLREVTGAELELSAIGERIREPLSA